MDNLETQITLGTQDTGEINVTENPGNIKNGQYTDTYNIGCTRHRTNKCERKHWEH